MVGNDGYYPKMTDNRRKMTDNISTKPKTTNIPQITTVNTPNKSQILPRKQVKCKNMDNNLSSKLKKTPIERKNP
jgi:hypothetical protein